VRSKDLRDAVEKVRVASELHEAIESADGAGAMAVRLVHEHLATPR
jgi:hypothetical protein